MTSNEMKSPGVNVRRGFEDGSGKLEGGEVEEFR